MSERAPEFGKGFRSAVGDDDVAKWQRRLEEDSAKERRATWQCMGVGLLLNGVVLGGGLILGEAVTRVRPGPRSTCYLLGLAFAASICTLMLIIAAFTKPEGRAEAARACWRGAEENQDPQHPGSSVAFAIAAIIALYGSFALIEAFKRLLMRWKLAVVDRARTAMLLAKISNAPAGLSWRSLVPSGQTFDSIRGPIALLILEGWVYLEDGGQTVMQRTPAMRKLMRGHPLAEIFALPVE